MVLAELGGRITKALSAMSNKVVIDEAALDEMLQEISRALIEADVNIKIVFNLRKNIKKMCNLEQLAAAVNKRRIIQRAVFDELCNMLDCKVQPYKPKRGQPNVMMFVGLQGAGKTTTVAKIAHYYQRKGWKAALVCADTFRAGAYDQLRQNAIKAGVHFYGSRTEVDPVKVATAGVARCRAEGFEIIIVDTSGRHKQEADLFTEMKQIEQSIQPDDVVFVMDGSIGQAAFEQAQAFRQAVSVGSVVVTKMDGHAKGGGALSAVAATQAPVCFVGTGEHFDDIEPFAPRSFVSRLLGMGDMGQLVDSIKDHVDLERQPELLQRLTEGKFTLRDMREQFQNILNMGPISKVISMLPSFASDLFPKGKEEEGQARIKRFMCMMDSMTDDELDNVKVIAGSRINRIARGSGTSAREVQELLDNFKKFSKIMSTIPKKTKGQDPASLMRQMQTSMDQMNPALLKQFGGAGRLKSLMKSLGSGMAGLGGGGFPGFPGMQ